MLTGWERMVLQILFLGPSNLLEPSASFDQMSQKSIVSPIVKTLVFSKVPEKVCVTHFTNFSTSFTPACILSIFLELGPGSSLFMIACQRSSFMHALSLKISFLMYVACLVKIRTDNAQCSKLLTMTWKFVVTSFCIK